MFLAAAKAHAGAFDGTPEDQFHFLELLQEQNSRTYANFAVIHAAPRGQWPYLVRRMIEGDWTVEDTRREGLPASDRSF